MKGRPVKGSDTANAVGAAGSGCLNEGPPGEGQRPNRAPGWPAITAPQRRAAR